MKKAERIFDGSLSCAEVPHRTHATVLLPLLKAGKGDEAMEHHRVGYPMIKGNPKHGRYIAMHIAFLALTHNESRSLRLFERYADPVLDGSDPDREFDFLRYSELAISYVAERKKKAKCRLPKILEPELKAGEATLTDIAEELHRRATELARRFDERNGNDFYTERLRKTGFFKKYASPHAFST